jgi:hypothetical protein
MSRQTDRYEARKADQINQPDKGPSGKRPTAFLENRLLATRANLRREWYLQRKAARRQRRLIEFEKNPDGSFARDKHGDRIPLRVLHETKGWQRVN